MAKILIIEDDEFLRDIYKETLAREGFSVDIAEDGESGFKKLKESDWDLALLDIILPKQDGLEIMRLLRSDEKFLETNKNKPIVFLTNLDNDNDIKEALKLGSGYLIKSQLTPEELLKEVNLYLKKDS